MQKRKLGKSGLMVSPVRLGCMGFGEPAKGRHSWTPGGGGLPGDHPRLPGQKRR